MKKISILIDNRLCGIIDSRLGGTLCDSLPERYGGGSLAGGGVTLRVGGSRGGVWQGKEQVVVKM